DIERAEILRQPTPALHVDGDSLRVGGLGARLALPPSLNQSLVQQLELLMLRIERAKIGIRRAGSGDFGHHLLRSAQDGRHAEQLAQLGRVGTSTASEARIFKDGEV